MLTWKLGFNQLQCLALGFFFNEIILTLKIALLMTEQLAGVSTVYCQGMLRSSHI